MSSYLQSYNKFCGLLLQNLNVTHQFVMSGEANFNLWGAVNKQIFCYWSELNLQQVHGSPLHNPWVTAWCWTVLFGIYCQYFFEDEAGTAVTVNAEYYGTMLWSFLATHLHAEWNIWLQQDGTTAHTAKVNMDLLCAMFGCRFFKYCLSYMCLDRFHLLFE
jgi:hypothetical protein